MRKVIYALALCLMTVWLSGCAGGQQPPKTAGSVQAILDAAEKDAASDTASKPETATDAPASDAPAPSSTADTTGDVLPQTQPKSENIGKTVDLTTMSSTMIYAEVFSMTRFPEDYLGKTITMRGQFTVYGNTKSGKPYFAVVIADATACCSQGIEFVLAGEHTYPDDYPKEGEEITVTGQYQSYEESGGVYYHLADAEIVSE